MYFTTWAKKDYVSLALFFRKQCKRVAFHFSEEWVAYKYDVLISNLLNSYKCFVMLD